MTHDELFIRLTQKLDWLETQDDETSRAIVAVYWLVSEHQGGGLHAYLWNSSGDGFPAVKSGFLRYGSADLKAWIVAVETIFGGIIPGCQDAREERLSAIHSECVDPFDDVDRAFERLLPVVDGVLISLLSDVV